MSKFAHHKYTWSKPWGSVQHQWELVGPNGAIHLHVTIVEGYDDSAGLEFHSRSGDGAPSQVRCWLLESPCWHDGTSLYAVETLWPMIKGMCALGDHSAIFLILESEYQHHFERDGNAMSAKPKLIDEACLGLARHFLADVANSTDEDVRELAELFQGTAETYCASGEE